jgi:hypothetical protein
MAQSPYLDQNAPEILALERQKKLADLLQARALEQPQGQMVSGRFVAPSLVQQLAPLANAYMGRKAGEDVESRQAKLANLMRGQQSTEIKNILGAFEGGDQSKALELAATGQTPFSQTVAGEMVKKRLIGKEPKWEKAELPNPDATTKVGYVDVNAPNPLTTFIEGGVKPPMTPYETATLKRKEFEWENLSAKDKASLANDAARLDISAKDLFFNTGMTGGGGYTPKPQAQPIAPQGQPSPQDLSNALRGQPTQTPTQAPVMPQTPQAQTQPLTKPQILQQNMPTDGGQLKLPMKMQLEILKEEQKPPTEFAGKAVLFGSAMNQAEKVINKLEKEGTTTGAVLPSVISGIVKLAPLGVGDAAANAVEAAFRADPTKFAGPDKNQQKLAQAQLAWSIAWLRQTSGANFGASEIASTIKEYFPLIGEDSSLVQQKNEARGARVKELEYLSGPSGAKRIQQYNKSETPEIDPEIYKFMTPAQQALFKKKKQ